MKSYRYLNENDISFAAIGKSEGEHSMLKRKYARIQIVLFTLAVVSLLIILLLFGFGCERGDNVAPPLILVDGVCYWMYDDSVGVAQQLNDSWAYVGKVRGRVSAGVRPKKNLHANHEIVGAEIYHSNEGRIRIRNTLWGDPINDEIIGNCVIVAFEGQFTLYISEEAHADVYTIMDTAERPSLMIDGVVYSLMSAVDDDDISIPDSFVYLGIVESTVPIENLPMEDFQANRSIVVGASVYRLPSGEDNDIVVFSTANSRYYYKHIPCS